MLRSVTNVIPFWLNVTFFPLSVLWAVVQVPTSPDMFALVASINCLRVLYFFSPMKLKKKKNSVIFWLGGDHERGATVPCRSELRVWKLQVLLTSCLVSVSTCPAALTWTWTVTATRRTTMTGTVREPRRLLTFVCVSVDSSSPLTPTPHSCLPSASQLSGAQE